MKEIRLRSMHASGVMRTSRGPRRKRVARREVVCDGVQQRLPTDGVTRHGSVMVKSEEPRHRAIVELEDIQANQQHGEYHEDDSYHSDNEQPTDDTELVPWRPSACDPYIAPFPSCPSQCRRSRLVQVLGIFSLDLTPLVFVPQRLGESTALDAATDALVQLPVCGNVLAARSQTIKSYSRALRHIHNALGSMKTGETLDHVVGAIMLLSFVDLIACHVGWDQSVFKSFTHYSRVTAILLGSPPSSTGSDILRSSVDHGNLCSFFIPVFSGVASPFDGTVWLEAGPASLHIEPCELTELYRISHQLFIRLPRLICMVRELKESHSPTLHAEVLQSATELLSMRDEEAENWLLHKVKVTRIALDDLTARRLVRYSFAFESLTQMQAGLSYWNSRLITLRLFSAIVDLGGHDAATDETTIASIKAEQQQAVKNLLMSWQHAKTSGYIVSAQFICPMIGIWGALREQNSFGGTKTPDVADWILDNLRYCACGWIVGKSRENLDAAADVLIGGPLEGHLVQLMCGSSPSRQNAEGGDVG